MEYNEGRKLEREKARVDIEEEKKDYKKNENAKERKNRERKGKREQLITKYTKIVKKIIRRFLMNYNKTNIKREKKEENK